MAEMRAAFAAPDLDPAHAARAVLVGRDVALLDDVVEARPSCAGFELGPGVEERFAAHDAAIRALAVMVPIGAAERWLRRGFLRHRVLDRVELGAKILALGPGRHVTHLSRRCPCR